MSLRMLSDEELDSVGFTFTWRIENFSYCLEKKNCVISSPSFIMQSVLGKTTWYLEVYPRGKFDNDLLGYNLRKVRYDDTNHISLDYQLSILASDDSLKESIVCKGGWFHQGATCLEEKFISRDELLRKKDLYLPEDTLTLQCCMFGSSKVHSWLGQGFARTRVGVEKRSVIWTIKNFSTLQLAQCKTFKIAPSLKEELSLTLYLTTGLDGEEKLEIAIYEANAIKDNLACFKIALVNSKGCLDFLTKSDHWFEKKEGIQVWNFPLSIPKSTLLANKSLYLLKDTLLIQCDCVFSIGVVSSELENHELRPNTAPEMIVFTPKVHRRRKETVAKDSDFLKADLLNLYTEKTFCDFNLRAGSETFAAHKTVLGARSPVFRAMISSDMVEKKSNVVDITDLDGATVKRMLHFMYTDTIEDLQWDGISKLYYAADKYGMQSMKHTCSSFLVSNLCTANVCEALELGDLHQDDALKTSAAEFIFGNDDKILLSDEWMQLLKTKGQLAAEIMHWMYLKKIGSLNVDTVL